MKLTHSVQSRFYSPGWNGWFSPHWESDLCSLAAPSCSSVLRTFRVWDVSGLLHHTGVHSTHGGRYETRGQVMSFYVSPRPAGQIPRAVWSEQNLPSTTRIKPWITHCSHSLVPTKLYDTRINPCHPPHLFSPQPQKPFKLPQVFSWSHCPPSQEQM